MEKHERERRKQIVIEQYEGILSYTIALYSRSILYSAGRAVKAYEDFYSSLGNDLEVFSNLQDALSHAAALSRFFFPIRSRDNVLADARRSKLRQIFEVNDDSSLANRALRNSLEHFDEKLEAFLLEKDAGIFLPDPVIGDLSAAVSYEHVFKGLSENSPHAVVLGQTFEYETIFAETERILVHARNQD